MNGDRSGLLAIGQAIDRPTSRSGREVTVRPLHFLLARPYKRDMTTNEMAAKLTTLLRCLAHAEVAAHSARTESAYRLAAKYARDYAAVAPYAARDAYWQCAARWDAMADAATQPG